MGVKLLNAILTSQLSIQLFYLSASHQIDVSYPLIVIRATQALFNNLTMKYTPKIRGRDVQLMLSERVLARWRRLVAFMKAMNLLYWVAIKAASKVNTF
jgi:hypothetical protein